MGFYDGIIKPQLLSVKSVSTNSLSVLFIYSIHFRCDLFHRCDCSMNAEDEKEEGKYHENFK